MTIINNQGIKAMDRKQIGQNIKKLRIQRRLTQSQLASLMGYKNTSTLAKVETGINDITIETLYRYSKVLGVDVSEILNSPDEVFDFSKLNISLNSSSILYDGRYFDEVVDMMANFRVTLRSYKNIKSLPDIESAKEEVQGYVEDNNYQIILSIKDNKVTGYILLKYDGVIFVEHIFIKKEYRRQGFAGSLYEVAEAVSNSLGGDTLFNFVHPNNNGIISFLKSRGYSFINLVEVRKEFKGEKPFTKIKVADNEFDY